MCVHKDHRGKHLWIGAHIDESAAPQQINKTERRQQKAIVEGLANAADGAGPPDLEQGEVVNDILERTGQKRIHAPTVRRYLHDWLRRKRHHLRKMHTERRILSYDCS